MESGIHVVPLMPPGTKFRDEDGEKTADDRQPVNLDWTSPILDEAVLDRAFKEFPDSGIGLALGRQPLFPPIVELLVPDTEEATCALEEMAPEGLSATAGWAYSRGKHLLYSGDDRLEGVAPIVVFPGGIVLKVRSVGSDRDTISVIPPTPEADGTPRRWNGFDRISPLPEAVYAALTDGREVGTKAITPAATLTPTDRPAAGLGDNPAEPPRDISAAVTNNSPAVERSSEPINDTPHDTSRDEPEALGDVTDDIDPERSEDTFGGFGGVPSRPSSTDEPFEGFWGDPSEPALAPDDVQVAGDAVATRETVTTILTSASESGPVPSFPSPGTLPDWEGPEVQDEVVQGEQDETEPHLVPNPVEIDRGREIGEGVEPENRPGNQGHPEVDHRPDDSTSADPDIREVELGTRGPEATTTKENEELSHDEVAEHEVVFLAPESICDLAHADAGEEGDEVGGAAKRAQHSPTTIPAPQAEQDICYDYLDNDRTLLFQAVRSPSKLFSLRRPDPAAPGEWIKNLNGVKRVPYRLPELLAADPALPVYIPEGEKDCDRLRRLGLVATTNPMGAGKWRDEYSVHLQGRDVVVLADNDDKGRDHVRKVAESLKGIAASVRILELPGLPPRGDVSDWLDAGGTVAGLEALANEAPIDAPSASTARRYDKSTVLEAAGPHFTSLAIDLGLDVTSKAPDAKGWRRCRAIDREDKKPSAGIHEKTGVYHDHGTGESLSFVALAMRLKPDMFPDEPAVLAYLAERYGIGPRLDEWELPLPFHETSLPPFPTDALNDGDRQFVEAEAKATQTPPDLAAMLALSVTAAACAKKVMVRVDDGYLEPVNIFTVTAQPPASRKSAVFRDVTAPIQERERELAQLAAPEVAEALAQKAIGEKSLEELYKKAAKADGAERESLVGEATGLALELAEAVIPRPQRLLADDATPESLTSLLAENGGKMGVFSPEGDIFGIMAGQYSRNKNAPSFGAFLKGHAGDDMRVDRKGRPPEFVGRPALTLGLAVQPEVIRGLGQIPGSRGRGLPARFLYAMPRSTVGYRVIDPPPVPPAIRQAYRDRVLALLALPSGTDEHGEPAEHIISLSQAARARLHEFAAWVEPQLADFGQLAEMADWAGKLPGAVVRIAGLLHLADRSTDQAPWEDPISAGAMERAIRIGRYLIPHARAAFALMGCDPLVEDAKYVLAWIRRHAGAAGEASKTFTKRDAFEGTKGRFKQVATLEPALGLLEKHHYIRVRDPEPHAGRGRPPSPTYEVNPHARDENGPVETPRPMNSANSANSANATALLGETSPTLDSANSANSANAIANPHHPLDPTMPGTEEDYEEGII